MLMVSLAWNLKAWFALMLPETGRWAELHREQKQRVLRMEFKGFLAAFIRIPCQIIQSGRVADGGSFDCSVGIPTWKSSFGCGPC